MLIYQGGRRQRGHGIGGVFKSLFRSAMPFIKEGGKIVAKNAVNYGANVLADISQGEDVVKSLERNGIKAVTGTAGDVADAVTNKSKKRKKKALTSRQAKRPKGHYFADIYDNGN